MTEGRDRTPDDKGQAALRRPLASVIRHPPSVSPLTWRIMAVNMLALAILGGSMFYLGGYQERLIQADLEALSLEARMIASALGEGAVIAGEEERDILSPDLARSMVRRLVESSDSRMRLFDAEGELIADSRMLAVTREAIQIEDVPPPDGWRIGMFWQILTDFVAEKIPRQVYAPYEEQTEQRAEHYSIAAKALQGTVATAVWRLPQGNLLLAAAVPVHGYKQVLGAAMATRGSAKIDAALAEVRASVGKAFLAVLGLTVLLSFYLARTIAGPLRQLAAAVRDVQHGQTQAEFGGVAAILAQRQIPDMGERADEIGELSRALRAMTAVLATRLSAIENFAADVAHELKNPLTSLRSAVETAAKIDDPQRQRKLMAVIRDDVDRLDRLLTDIASASRLDAELSRAQAESVDIGKLMEALADFYAPMDAPSRVAVMGEIPAGLTVRGLEGRLAEVMRNLIDNALSFLPEGGSVRLWAVREGDYVRLTVDDDGPGIPDNKLEAIFDRFYSERPRSEKFGLHSGLGLSIAKQITEAHRGRLWAENRHDENGHVIGARFTVLLPVET